MCLFLFTPIATPDPARGWCVQSKADISVERRGHWVSGRPAHRGNFSRALGRTEWIATACPVQQRVFACHRYSKARPRAFAVEHRRFVPDDCAFHQFSPLVFLQAIANRRLLFCCDSISQQFFEAVVCSVHGTTRAVYDIKWLLGTGRFGPDACGEPDGRHCHLGSAIVSWLARAKGPKNRGESGHDGAAAK
eukprot:EG_transcript_26916